MFKFNIGNVVISISAFDWSKKHIEVTVHIPLENQLITAEIEINQFPGQQMKVSVELGDGIPF